MDDFFGTIDQLGIIEISFVFIFFFVDLYLIIWKRVKALLFLLVMSATFSGFVVTQIDAGFTILRYLCIFSLFIIGLINVNKLKLSLPIVFFWLYIFTGILFLFMASNPAWQLQRSFLLAITALAIPLALSPLVKELKGINQILLTISRASIPFSLLSLFFLPNNIESIGRYSGFLTGAPNYALIAGTIALFLLWGVFNAPKRFERIVLAVSFFSTFISLLFCAQRTGVFAAMTGLLLYIAYKLRKGFVKSAFWIGIAILFLGIFMFYYVPIEKVDFMTARYQSSNLTNRNIIWNSVLQMIRENPLIGHGIGAAEQVISSSFHNAYLEVWFNTGLSGLIFFVFSQIWLIVTSIILVIKSRSAQISEDVCLSLGFIFGFIIMSSFESYGAGASNVGIIIYLVIMIILSGLAINEKNSYHSSERIDD